MKKRITWAVIVNVGSSDAARELYCDAESLADSLAEMSDERVMYSTLLPKLGRGGRLVLDAEEAQRVRWHAAEKATVLGLDAGAVEDKREAARLRRAVKKLCSVRDEIDAQLTTKAGA